MKKVQLIFTVVFGLIGSGILAGAAVAVYSTLSFRSEARRVEGQVVALSWSGGSACPVVRWTDPKGEVHEVSGTVRSKPPAYSVGEKVTVWYNPFQLSHARIGGFLEEWFVGLMLAIPGTIFFSIGAGFGIVLWRRKRKRAWLHANGTRIQARVTGVALDTRIRVNGRCPRRLTAQWLNPATSEVHVFQSEALWSDPSEFVKDQTVEVLIHPERPTMYWMDISFLPPLAR